MDVFEQKYIRCSTVFFEGRSADAVSDTSRKLSAFNSLTVGVHKICYAAPEIDRKEIRMSETQTEIEHSVERRSSSF